MATAKKTPRRTRPSKAMSEKAELAKLIREHEADDGNRRVSRLRRHTNFEDARHGARRPALSAPRLCGDELREVVRDLARRMLLDARCEQPAWLVTDTDAQARRDVDRQAAAALRSLTDSVSLIRELAQLPPRAGWMALAELHEIAPVLEQLIPHLDWRERHPAIAGVLGYRGPLAALTRRKSTLLAPWASPAPKVVSRVAALTGPGWTDRARACAALAAGYWPPSIKLDEPLTAAHVIEAARVALKKQRQRRAAD